MSRNIDVLKLREEWDKNGFVVLKNVLPKKDIEKYLKITKKMSGLNDDNFKQVINGEIDPFISTSQPLVKNEEFWDLFINDNILEYIRNAIDKDISFYGVDGMFVHRSAITLHRDSFIGSDDLTGPDFDPELKTLTNIRAAIQLVPNKMVVVPGSHRKAYPNKDRTDFNQFKDMSIVVEINPGDILLFDTMLLHAGAFLTKPKYMLVWNYVSRNRHTLVGKYYTQLVTSYILKPFENNFVNFLKEYNLYWDDMWNDDKHLPYFNKLWEKMPKHSDAYSKNNLENYTEKHWSPYKEKLY